MAQNILQTNANLNASASLATRASKLWDDAFRRLDQDDQKQVSDLKDDRQQALREVLDAAKGKRDDALTKRWRFKRGDRVIILRDVFEKIVTWTSKFAAVVDVAVNADPVHAGLPWAAVRFLLQITTSEVQAFGYLSEGIEILCETLARYAIVEKVFLAPSSQPHDADLSLLSDSVVEVYAAILAYLARAKAFWSDGTAKRVATSFLRNTETVAKDLKNRINIADAQAYQVLALVQYRSLLDYLNDVKNDYSRTATDISELHDNMQQGTRRELFQWLTTIPCEAHHDEAKRSILSGTGEWLVAQEDFLRWRNSSSSAIFWLHGIPGAGKSKLTSLVIQAFLDQHNINPTYATPLAFFYCSRKGADTRRTEYEEIMRALLRQLIGRKSKLPFRGSISEIYLERKEVAEDTGAQIPKLDFEETVRQILEISSQDPMVIVLDALDEADPKTRFHLLDGLERIVDESSNVVKIFVSSREDRDITDRLESHANLGVVQGLNQGDIAKFVENEVDKAVRRGQILGGEKYVSQTLRNDIVTTLIAKSQGMFRWVELSIETLCDSQRLALEEDVRLELGKLPKDLKQQYAVIYESISNAGPATASSAHRIFSWILGSRRVLSTEELVAAVALDEKGRFHKSMDKHKLLDMCRNFLVETSIDATSNIKTIQVAHLSVREFLEDLPQFSSRSINDVVVSRCLDEFLQNHRLSINLEMRAPATALRRYCVWVFVHASLSGLTDFSSRLALKMTDFLFDSKYEAAPSFKDWVRTVSTWQIEIDMSYDDPDDRMEWGGHRELLASAPGQPQPTAMALLFQCGLLSVLSALSKIQGFPWDSYLVYQKKPFIKEPFINFAISERQNRVVHFIIRRGLSEVNFPDVSFSRQPLFQATRLLHDSDIGEEILRLLLDCGADPLCGPLIYAPIGFILSIRKSSTLFSIFLEAAERIAESSTENHLVSPQWKNGLLRLAIFAGAEDPVALLLSKGADIYSTPGYSEYLKFNMAWIVPVYEHQILLSDSSSTTLHIACARATPTLVEMILSKSSSTLASSISPRDNKISNVNGLIHARDSVGRTVMQYIMYREDNKSSTAEAIIGLLIRHGYDMSSVGDDGTRTLHVAAWTGSGAMVDLSISTGVEVTAVTNQGRNALHYALKGCSPSPALIKKLLGQGTDLFAEDENGDTPLHYAASYNPATIPYLIEIANNLNNPPQVIALCKTEKSPESPHILYQNATCQISHDPSNTVDRILSLQNKDGHSILHVFGSEASRSFQEMPLEKKNRIREAIRLLMTLGAKSEKRDLRGMTPLNFWLSHFEIRGSFRDFEIANIAIKELLAHGADSHIPGKAGKYPLHYAVLCYSFSLAEILVKSGSSLEVSDAMGRTPLLMLAKENPHMDSHISFLLSAGADPNARDSNGTTPLHFLAGGCSPFPRSFRALIRSGAGVNVVDNQGRTPLHHAASKGLELLSRLLLSEGANSEAVDIFGRTPLLYAAWRNLRERELSNECWGILLRASDSWCRENKIRPRTSLKHSQSLLFEPGFYAKGGELKMHGLEHHIFDSKQLLLKRMICWDERKSTSPKRVSSLPDLRKTDLEVTCLPKGR